MSANRNIISFVNNADKAPDPVEASEKLRFRDLTFIPELRNRTSRFETKTNWVRFLPTIQGSSYTWMMRVETIKAPDGQGERLPTFCHPKSFSRGATSPFDEAHAWLRRNRKEALHNREKNPGGLKLTPMSQGVAWMIDSNKEPGEKLSLFYSSLYDGAWGGSPGLAFKVWQEANQKDTEPGSPTFDQKIHADITAELAGNLVLIEKHKPETGDRFSSYVVRVGKTAAPLKVYTDMLSDEEYTLLRPLEKTFYRPDDNEQHAILREYIGSKLYLEIFGSDLSTGLDREREPVTAAAEPQTPAARKVEEPTPEPEAPAAKAPVEKEAAPAAAKSVRFEEPETKPVETGAAKKEYSVREVTRMLGNKEETKLLLENLDSLNHAQREVVLEVARDFELDVTPYTK